MAEQEAHATGFNTHVYSAVSREESFLRLTATGCERGKENPWVKATVRIVELSSGIHWQFTYFDTRKSHTKNCDESDLKSALDEIMALPFSTYHIQSVHEDLHLRITKKGKALLSVGKPSRTDGASIREHDRSKSYPIPEKGSEPLWQAIGIMDADGRIKPSRRDKFLQVNEFIKLLSQSLSAIDQQPGTLSLIDCGCGNAYLTFAAYHYLTAIRERNVRFTGVDANQELIDHCNALRDTLGWGTLDFKAATIAEYIPGESPDVVLSLHACDTATDEAIAQGVTWNSRVILAAPCCQHELRNQIESGIFLPVTRHGILKQRTADILTDACRAQILRILGYDTDVVEFIDSSHTPKNLMIRAHRDPRIDIANAAKEYKELVAFWNIRPALARYLDTKLAPFLQ